MSAPDEPRPNTRWEYRYQDGRVDRFGVSGVVSRNGRPEGRSVMTMIGGCPVGAIRMSTWSRWKAEGRLVEVTP